MKKLTREYEAELTQIAQVVEPYRADEAETLVTIIHNMTEALNLAGQIIDAQRKVIEENLPPETIRR